MNGLNSWLKNNFGYSRKEINGTIVLFLGIFLAFVFSFAWDYWLYTKNEDPTKQELQELEEWASDIHWIKAGRKEVSEQITSLVITGPFDPNKVDRRMLEAMKLPDYVAGNWIKFLASGGQFFKNSDVRRIYGLDSGMYVQLEPFISIEPKREHTRRPASVEKKTATATTLPIKKSLNRASAGELREVRGIGPVLSERIVKYRNSLGGFYTREQLKAVYGIKPEVLDELWQKFELDSAACCVKIALNVVGVDSLGKHPYLNYNQARAIVAYREQHGPFRSWGELAEIRILSDSLVEKMKIYFEL